MRTKNNSVRLAKIQQMLREEIKNSGMTQREIAAATCVSAQTVSRYMTDDIFPALDTLARLCEVLDVSADYILGTEKN